MFGSEPPQTPALRALMIAGLAKPIETWNPAGPYSWKKLGSPTRRNESWAFWPSSVFVWSHSSPRAMRSAPGVAITPQRPGIRLAMTAWPASGDSVLPSDSYFGQVTIIPVIPVWVGSGIIFAGLFGSGIIPVRELNADAPTGHASFPLFGSFVPARLLVSGWLNIS